MLLWPALLGLVQAQSFPNHNLSMVVPFSAGGTADLFTRPLSQALAAHWGHSVVVENVPGGDTTIGASRVAQAVADGHTLLMTNSQSLVGNRFLFKKMPYDPDKSLIPVIMVARSGSFLMTHPSFPATSIRELVNMARAQPGQIAYASTGRGSAAQLVLETLGKREKISFNHIPYKGVAPAMTALASGEDSIGVFTPAGSGAMVRAGKVRPIAITSKSRLKLFPQVPSVVEAGYPYLTYLTWFGLFVPAATSPQIVQQIYRDVERILKQPQFVEKYIASASLDAVGSHPEEFAASIRDEIVNVGAMVSAANLLPQ
ncbi:MAG: tripartite tricarboxylate transporter substrate binding protein [Betaproteobacteria bacterium]